MSQIFQDIKNSWSSQSEHDQDTDARPFRIIVVVIVVSLIGVWYTFAMLTELLALQTTSSTSALLSSFSQYAPGLSVVDALISFISVVVIIYTTILAFLHFYLARGIWKVQLWAYWGTIAVEVVSILIAFIVLLVTHNGGMFFASAYIPILIAAYLLIVSSVRKSFNVPF